MEREYFHGKDGYVWWHGVVEDRKDPMFLGRCRVRILGWHTADKAELPTADLPWAYPMLPFNNDQVVHPPKEGTWVLGFFRDGVNAQDRIVLGTINTGAFTDNLT